MLNCWLFLYNFSIKILHPFCFCTCLNVILGKFQFLPVCHLTIDVIFNNNKTRRRYFLSDTMNVLMLLINEVKHEIRKKNVCLGFIWSHSRIFQSFGDVAITVEGLQILPMLGTHGH